MISLQMDWFLFMMILLTGILLEERQSFLVMLLRLNGQMRRQRQSFYTLSGVRQEQGLLTRLLFLNRWNLRERQSVARAFIISALWKDWSLERMIISKFIRQIWSFLRSLRIWREVEHAVRLPIVLPVVVRQKCGLRMMWRRYTVWIRIVAQRK